MDMVNKLGKKIIIILIIVGLTSSIFVGGFLIGKKSVPEPTPSDTIIINKELGQSEVVDFSLFWQVLKAIEKNYVDSSEIDYQEIVYGAISGMVEALNDSYTVFMKPNKTEEFIESVETGGSFEGVGMEIAIKGGILTVVSPLQGTPAMSAGIRAGDKIIEIDGKSTDGILLEEAVNKIRGERGTQVILTVVRPRLEDPKEISVTRDTIQIPIAKHEMKTEDIAYIKIYHFTGNSPSKFKNIVQQVVNAGAKKIILDLRNNPGGYLSSAVEAASWFIPQGEVIAIEDRGENEESKKYRSKGYKLVSDFPVVVLVNQGSASASEIVAGALRDIKGIKLVGEQTFGKGSIQMLEKFNEGSALKVTVAKWLTPSGISISKEGLEPDVKVELTDEDFDKNRDPQLDQAIELLK